MLDKSKIPAKETKPSLNDDIGEDKRLELYRLQVLLRQAEQRAFDLFLQNLVKGTSHLSLGQEAVAAAAEEGAAAGASRRGRPAAHLNGSAAAEDGPVRRSGLCPVARCRASRVRTGSTGSARPARESFATDPNALSS